MEVMINVSPTHHSQDLCNTWTVVEDFDETHNQLIASICVPDDKVQETFPGVQLLGLHEDLRISQVSPVAEGMLALNKRELIFHPNNTHKKNEESFLTSASMLRNRHMSAAGECDLDEEHGTFRIPLTMIAKIDVISPQRNVVDICLKNLRVMRFRFSAMQLCEYFLYIIQKLDKKGPEPLALLGNDSFDDVDNKGWDIFDCRREFFDRMGISSSDWRIVSNDKYSLCPTYPSQFIAPKSVSDSLLKAAAGFRCRRRIPILCWQNPTTRATLSRCSQPMVGFSLGLWGGRSDADERLVQAFLEVSVPEGERKAARKSLKKRHRRGKRRKSRGSPEPLSVGSPQQGPQMCIMDCRSLLTAYANSARGAGTENIDNYPGCTLKFLNIENIHKMRDAYRQLASVLTRHNPASELLHDTQSDWCVHTQSVLSGAVQIAAMLHKGNTSVLVHCSDGWDRTTQLSALAQLMLDAYYRTIIGFEVLIEKEWLAFGHKFDSRCGRNSIGTFFSDHESSPIFLQFMDCVWQIYRQTEDAFEFNEQFLITILDNVYSCKYGTFLYDNEKKRRSMGLKDKTPSLWGYINANLSQFTNPKYDATKYQNGELVCPRALLIELWEGYYLRFNRPTAQTSGDRREYYLGRGMHSRSCGEEYKRAMSAPLLDSYKKALQCEASEEKVPRTCKESQTDADVEERDREVTCTVRRASADATCGERVLVAKMNTANKALISNLRERLRSLTIYEDYNGPESVRGARTQQMMIASPGTPIIRRRSESIERLEHYPGIFPSSLEDGWTSIDMGKGSVEIEYEEDSATSSESENSDAEDVGDGLGALALNEAEEKEDESIEDEESDLNEEDWSKLGDEVVTVEVQNGNTSWTNTVRLGDLVSIVTGYLRDYGITAEWMWSSVPLNGNT